jgi:Secretion system C-terminal sorting domain
MKHIYLPFTVLFCGFLNAQIINFPDANFKAKLLQANSTNGIALNVNESPVVIDVNANGEIEVAEVQSIKALDISNSGIADLSGISNFASLKWLRCANNLLTEITIDSSIAIEQLLASNNSISSVSVNFGENIEGVDLSYNNLTSFALDGGAFWESFNLSHNQLSSLTLSNLSMEYFNISHNNLDQIQFVGTVWLYRTCNFSNNQFTILDVSDVRFQYEDGIIILGNNVEDVVLFPSINQPSNVIYSSNNTSLDLGNFQGTHSCDPEYSGHVSITNSPNLENIIFKNGFSHGYIWCYEGGPLFQLPALNLGITNCPSLNHICVDEGDDLMVVQNRINQLGLQSQVVVDGNCTSSVLGEATFVLEEPFSVSPVPAQDILQITIKNTMTIDNLQVYNNVGQLVLKENGAHQSVDVSNLSSGSYFIKINTNDGAFVKQFLKE